MEENNKRREKAIKTKSRVERNKKKVTVEKKTKFDLEKQKQFFHVLDERTEGKIAF